MVSRLIVEDGVAAAAGLATDEVLAQRVGVGTSAPTLRLYTYRPHCALVGRFQDVAHEVDEVGCERHGIEINRRPTGGGAILMGPDQLGIALALPRRGDGVQGHARALMERFSRGIVSGLGMLGVSATFRGKNDLQVDGRKIAGLGIYRDPSGGLLFHASVLVDLDVALMARVLRLPSTVDAAELAVLKTRTTTVRECVRSAIGLDEVRGRIAAGFAGALGVAFETGDLDDAEQAAAGALVRDKYATQAWIRQETAVADTVGVASLRTPGGTVEARVALAGRTIKSVQIRGDFFEESRAVADLESRLRWRAATAAAATVTEWARARPVETVPAEAFARAIEAAVARASQPYGCFVDPEGAGRA